MLETMHPKMNLVHIFLIRAIAIGAMMRIGESYQQTTEKKTAYTSYVNKQIIKSL